jgi:hypothetical protein
MLSKITPMVIQNRTLFCGNAGRRWTLEKLIVQRIISFRLNSGRGGGDMDSARGLLQDAPVRIDQYPGWQLRAIHDLATHQRVNLLR